MTDSRGFEREKKEAGEEEGDRASIVALQRLDRLGARDARLRHHQLDVLGLHASLVHLDDEE